MTKLMTKFFGLLFVVAFFFCFSACYSTTGLNGSPSDGIHIQNPGSIEGSGTNSPISDYSNIQAPEALFLKDEEGNYVFFKEEIDFFQGAQLMSVPHQTSVTENENTNKERRRFYEDLDMQFYVVSAFALHFLVGHFGSGTAGLDVKQTTKEFQDDYVLNLSAITPTERSGTIGDTDEYVIEQVTSGWTYDGTTLTVQTDTSKAWVLNLGRTGSNYEDDYVEAFEPFLRLRLIEIVSNKINGTNYVGTPFSEASTPFACETLIAQRLKNFSALGYEFGDFDVEGDVAKSFKDVLLDEVIGQTALSYQEQAKSFSEPMGEDETVFYDINENGVYDSSFSPNAGTFYTNYETPLNTLFEILKNYVDGSTQNNPIPSVDKMEVQDILSENFFNPGLKAEESQYSKNSLTNMDYLEYKSCTLFPKENYFFDEVMIFVDSQIDFTLKVWVKFCYGDVSFVAPLCLMEVDHTKDYDWAGDEENGIEKNTENNYQTEKEEEREIYQKYLFENEGKRNMVIAPLEYVLTETQIQILRQIGVRQYGGEMNYLDRGYHTNSQDNLGLVEEYSVQTFLEGKKLLSFSGNDNYVEFLFEVVDPQPETEYGFKFIVYPYSFAGFDDENTSTTSIPAKTNTVSQNLKFDVDRKVLKNFD